MAAPSVATALSLTWFNRGGLGASAAAGGQTHSAAGLARAGTGLGGASAGLGASGLGGAAAASGLAAAAASSPPNILFKNPPIKPPFIIFLRGEVRFLRYDFLAIYI